MDLEVTPHLDKVLSDIDSLKRKAKLLDILLSHYDDGNMEFRPLPEKWGKRFHVSKFPAPTPKLLLAKEIRDHLTDEELTHAGLYNL